MHTRTQFHAVILALLLAFSSSSFAVTPTTVSYQGYLTDPSGAALDGSFSIDFSIYTVSAGGVALWTSNKTVSVSKGLLSVQLGDTVLFPVGLFANPTYLGIDVDTDGEMSPRTVFDSVAFAFKADDALTLEGSSAASLDQSAHVIDLANPHAVTATQVGAADAATLTAHTGDTGNPHSVTAAQTGAATAASITADIATHAGNSAAHHSRYNNGEAITAMGAKTDGNALNHDKYTDSAAVAAVLAADGAGSTLDADLVDGLEASDIISAASDEVRTPISSLPFTISTPGSYYLTGNLTVPPGTGNRSIDITTDNVTLDLMGFTLFGVGANDIGIDLDGQSAVTIKNGKVRDFGRAGIFQGSGGRFIQVFDVQALGNGPIGSSTIFSGIYLAGSNNHVERCTAGDNGGYGIFAGVSSHIVNNTAYNNGGTSGIFGGNGSTITGNTAYNNQETGIRGDFGSTITGNTAYNNGGAFGIFGFGGSAITGNTAYNNARWGISAASSNLVKDNTIHNNNTSNTANEGGLRVGNDSRVIGNTLDSNLQNNIVFVGSDTAIESNHVTDSGTGINFTSGGNFYRNNTASGNSTNYGGTQIGTTTDGGGNVSF